jgi:HSP20 family protein
MSRNTNPMTDLERWSYGLERILSSLVLPERGTQRMWHPPTDVYETEDSVVIKVEIAGMNPDDLHISFADRILQIRGVRLDKQPKQSCHCLELQFGEFLSQVYLPGRYDQEQIEANYENGFLTITLPTLPPEPPHLVQVQASEIS